MKRTIPAGDLRQARDLLDSAQYQGVVTTVTRYGTRAAVVVPPELWDQLTGTPAD